MIRKCTCKAGGIDKIIAPVNTRAAQYQDEKYGYGNRVFNKTTEGWRCTVCGFEKLVR